jgi:release factor glutamine methyltransferase
VGRVRFYEGDLLAPLRPAGEAFRPGRLDLVVSNPPYVDPADREGLAPEVRDHEPPLALFPPGPDPTAIYARLAEEAREALAPGGALVVEIGQGMEDAVGRHLRAARLREGARRTDLQGIVRTLVAWRD